MLWMLELKIVVNIMLYFLENTKNSGPSAQNCISETYDCRSVYPKGFLVLVTFKACREPSLVE